MRKPFSVLSFYRKAILTLFTGLLFHHFSFGQQWSTLGNENQISSVAAFYTTITIIGDIPYVAYVEGAASGGTGKVKRRDPSTGLWEQVGNDLATNITYTRIYKDKSNALFVTYVDVANGNRLAMVTLNTATQSWEPLVAGDPFISAGTVTNTISQFSSTPRSSLAFDSDNHPYVFYSERAVNGNPFVKRLVSSTWEIVGGGPVAALDTAVGNNIALDENNEPYVVYVKQSNLTSTAGSLRAYRFNTGTGLWENISPVSPVGTTATTGVRHTSITMDSTDNPILSYFNTSNSNRSTIIRYNKGTAVWNSLGTTSGRDAPHNSLIRDNGGNVYNMFQDAFTNGGTIAMVRVSKLRRGATLFTELRNDGTRGIDSIATGYLNIAVGSDTSKPFVVYTKPNSGGIPTPIVQTFNNLISTKTVTNITTGGAATGGNIQFDGGSVITERGVVYGQSANPTMADTKIVDAATGIGSYTAAITGLAAGETYFVRAYFINASGTFYGSNLMFTTQALPDVVVTTPKQMELLNRGVVAVRTSASNVYVGWRLLGTDPANIAFNIYRDGVKLNATPVTATTNYEDAIATDGAYVIKPVINGQEGNGSAPVTVWATNQLSIPLQIPADGTTPLGDAYSYSPNDCSVGDVDGDGEYEVFVKWDPSNAQDNSIGGYTGNVYLDCYKLNGTRLWRIDLGRNIRAGAHYTQFMVYDFDGDGKAEMACKTADATIDGIGVVIGDPVADYRNAGGYVLTGPEYLTIFNGLTGAAMATTNYLPARGTVTSWGDDYGNRVDRFIAAVAYLDGARPSLIMGRGYYTRLVRVAWDWRNNQLTHRWTFDSNSPGNAAYAGQGNHQMTIGDVDGDGKDEIINGSSTINDNGKGLWANGYGHGDCLHMSDMDPDRPGQEIWQCLESEGSYSPYGLRFNDAKTGVTQFGVPTSGDVGRSMAADVDATRKGYEMWGSSGGLYDCKGNMISTGKPTSNFGIWWDGDLSRELLDGTKIDKWNSTTNSLNRLFTIYQAAPVSSNNSTKSNPCLQADLLGDWREEMIFRRTDNTALILFTTTIPTDQRIYTLMHNPQYRAAIAWQNAGYNQAPYPDYYLGTEMTTPPLPNIYLGGNIAVPIRLLSFTATAQDNQVLVSWSTTNEVNNKCYVVERSANGQHFTALGRVNDKGNTGGVNNYSIVDEQPLDGINYYRLQNVDHDGNGEYSTVRKVVFNTTKKLRLYPNPAGSFVKLDLPQSTGTVIASIFQADGKLVYKSKGSLVHINNEINALLPRLKHGYYPVEVVDKDTVFKGQLIKQ